MSEVVRASVDDLECTIWPVIITWNVCVLNDRNHHHHQLQDSLYKCFNTQTQNSKIFNYSLPSSVVVLKETIGNGSV